MGGTAADNFNSKHVKFLNIAKKKLLSKGIKLSVIIKKLLLVAVHFYVCHLHIKFISKSISLMLIAYSFVLPVNAQSKSSNYKFVTKVVIMRFAHLPFSFI